MEEIHAAAFEDSSPRAFATAVLDRLRQRRVTFRGCKPIRVEIELSGRINAVFRGDRTVAGAKVRDWEGRFTIINASLAQGTPEAMAAALADPNAIAEAIEHGIAHAKVA